MLTLASETSPHDAPTLATVSIATVSNAVDGGWRLSAPDLVAVRAASCLVPPRVGDRVAVVVASPTEAYIIAVLTPHERTTVAVDGELSIEAGAVSVTTRRARLVAQEAAVVARKLASSFDRSTLVGRALDVVADVVTQRAGSSVRTTAGLDRTSAGTVELRAETALHATGRQTLVTGEQLAKINGDQVHVG